MERESLLAVLIILLGGMAMQLFAALPVSRGHETFSRRRELRLWLGLWWPLASALTVAAWLCGWALSQPDPVPGHVSGLIFVLAVPFLAIGLRAMVRAAWSLCHTPAELGIATVGIFEPRIVIAPELAEALDPPALRAALAHERAHLLHRDPLRIWLAQVVTDLQWPWGSAQRRFTEWLGALELARDDEARAQGVDGADLAAAVLGSVKFQVNRPRAVATLIGRPEALPMRIARLLAPLPAGTATSDTDLPYLAVTGVLTVVWSSAILLGLACGEPLIDTLLAL